MRFSNEFRSRGIRKVGFKLSAGKDFDIYLHLAGMLNSDLPGAKIAVNTNEEKKVFIIDHQVMRLLDFDGEPCVAEENYDRGACQSDYISQVIGIDNHTSYNSKNGRYMAKTQTNIRKLDLAVKYVLFRRVNL